MPFSSQGLNLFEFNTDKFSYS